jgi:hypothetical protein
MLYPKLAAKSETCAKLVELTKKQMKDYGKLD